MENRKFNEEEIAYSCYYDTALEFLKDEFYTMRRDARAPCDVDLNEVVEFKAGPVNADSIRPIQVHFAELGIAAIRKLRKELHGGYVSRDMSFSCELTVYGENGYTTKDPKQFVSGVLYDLPAADGFKIVSNYFGPEVVPTLEADLSHGMRVNRSGDESSVAQVNVLKAIGETEEFTYHVQTFLYNSDCGHIAEYINGEAVNTEEMYSADILDKDLGGEWMCSNLDLAVEFDFEKHQDILASLHDTVRKRIPEDMIEYCENDWAAGDVGILCSSISWEPRKLREVQDFLDELNGILRPIMSECSGSCMGGWFYTNIPLGAAEWNWTEEGFKITGTELIRD